VSSATTTVIVNEPRMTPFTGGVIWADDNTERPSADLLMVYTLYSRIQDLFCFFPGDSVTSIVDKYIAKYTNETVLARETVQCEHLIASIGLSPIEAIELHLRLKSFESDWDAPGMEEYDAL